MTAPTPDDPAPRKGKRGPAPKKLGDDERARFVELIRGGFGIQLASASMKMSWHTIDRARREDKSFDRDIRHAIAYRQEHLVSLRYAQALAGDTRALDFLINRDDAARRFTILRRDARRAEGRQSGDAAQLRRDILTMVEAIRPVDVTKLTDPQLHAVVEADGAAV